MRYAPGPVDGAFSLPGPLPSGYVWTYLGKGTDFTDAPDLVVVMPGYEAPHRCIRFLAGSVCFSLVSGPLIGRAISATRDTFRASGG